MKKIFSTIIAVVMITSISATAFASTITTGTGSDSADVKAKYITSTQTDVYSVDVTWGAMEFDYNADGQKWNTDSHKWEADGSAPASWTVNNSSNSITLANHSSKAVEATFSFEANTEYTSLDGKFAYDGSELNTALELELPQADTAAKEYVVTFEPTGSIPATHSTTTYDKMGTITVTFG